ncbi:hypothetical protein BSZ39_12605 [Bowdeniella nasicola]|uniref:Uncharacterized protein n=1 Tax=Bowdeniella nasicola TaxID=208480 RepID=A0A1Q5PXI1_9ACTO|nr:hypothetical protein BSZ39_12605 [Bowdeniella nasicola]
MSENQPEQSPKQENANGPAKQGLWDSASRCVVWAAGATGAAVLVAMIAFLAFGNGSTSGFGYGYEVRRAAENFSSFLSLAGLLSLVSAVFGYRAFYLVAKRVESMPLDRDA